MKYLINSLIILILLSCFISMSYLTLFSESSEKRNHAEYVLLQDNKELIFAFQNYKLVSIEVNDFLYKNLKFNKMFKLTFKDGKIIKQFYLHEKNINILSKNLFHKNQISNNNYSVFQFHFSNLFSHYYQNKEREIINFMNFFVNNKVVQRHKI